MQLEGNIQFGLSPDSLTDYSDEISSLTLNTQTQTTSRPKTFASAREEQRKSGLVDSVGINFFNDERDPLGFWLLCWDAQRDDSQASGREPGELYFSAQYYTEEQVGVGQENPTFTGWVLVGDLDTGGTVGEWKQQSKTWPAREVDHDGGGS
jgi:hypothetical protein